MCFSSEILLFFGITAVKVIAVATIIILILKIAKRQDKRRTYEAAKAELNEIEQELNNRQD